MKLHKSVILLLLGGFIVSANEQKVEELKFINQECTCNYHSLRVVQT